MWEGYVNAVAEVLPETTLVIDRFHVAQHYRDGVDELRKQEVQRLKRELPKAAQEEIKHTLWPFRKRASKREADEQERLEALLASSPALQHRAIASNAAW